MAGLLEKSAICPILVGRAEELAALGHRLELARAGQGQVVLVSAEAGVGKTRLVEEMKAQAIHLGFAVLQGNCTELDRNLPYGPLVELLRGLLARQPEAMIAQALGPQATELAVILPELQPAPGALQPPIADRYRLFHGMMQVFLRLAEQAPLLVVIEDAHWSDDASLDFLLHLAQRLPDRPLALLVTYRAEAAGDSLANFLTALNRARLAGELTLERLTREEAQAMQRAIFAQQQPISVEFQEAIYQLTEGNPFFIEEILKSLIAAGDLFLRDGVWEHKPLQQLRIPHSIEMAVQQRTAPLDAGSRQVMLLASVVGRQFGFELLQALTGLPESRLFGHLKLLAAAQIVVEETAERYAFRHALTREAVYGMMLQRERQQYHRAIAEILERADGGLDRHVAELAHHYGLAGAPEKARVYAQRAGERAQALFAPREAAELFTRAAEAAQRLGQPPSAELHRARGQAYETLGEIESARADYEQALRLAQQAGVPRVEWQCLVDLGFVWAAQDYTRAGSYFQRALELARALGDPALRAHSLNRLGNWHANIDQPQAAREYHLEALALFEKLRDQPGRAESLDLLGTATTMTGDYFSGFAYYQQAVDLFEAMDDRRGLASSLSVMAECGSNYLLDAASVAPITLPESEGHAQRALDIARQIGWRSGEAYALVALSLCAGSLGHLALALEQSQQALEIATEIDHYQWMSFAHIAAGLARVSLLDSTAARRHLELALALAQNINSQYWTGIAAALLASTLIDQSELEAAAALLNAKDGGKLSLHSLPAKLIAVARLELAMAEGAAADAEPEVVKLVAAVYPSDLKLEHSWQAAPRLLQLHGEVLAVQKRFPEATAKLEAALAAADAQGARPLAWRVQAALGRCWQAQRRFDAADAAFGTARGLIESLAGEMPEGELRQNFKLAALAQLPCARPGTSRRAAKREFGGLTVRERDIAGRVGRGHSNREIAAALVISDRTVEKHVSNILGKLGLATRAQLIAWALQKKLVSKLPD